MNKVGGGAEIKKHVTPEHNMSTVTEVPSSEKEFRMYDIKLKEHDDAMLRKQRSLRDMDSMHKNLISAMSVSSLGASLSNTSTTRGTVTPSSRSSSIEMSHDEEEATTTLLSQSAEVKTSIKQGVSFGHVHVREHERTVGCNPCVSSGPALDLSWKYTDQTVPPTSVDDFEHMRTYTAPRRNKSELILYRMEREKILKFDNDVSRSEIAAAVRSINRSKSNRRQTLHNLKYHQFEQMWERIKRGALRAFGIRKSTHMEIKTLWKNAEKNLEKSARKKERSSSSGSRSGMFKSKSEKKINTESEHISDCSKSRRRLFSKDQDKVAEPSLSNTNHRYKRDVGVSSSTKHVKEYDLTPGADDFLSNSKHGKIYELGLDASISSSKHVKKFDLGLDSSLSVDDSKTPTTSNHGALKYSLGSESACGADVNSDKQFNSDDAITQDKKKRRQDSSTLSNKIKIKLENHNGKDMDNRSYATDLSVSNTSRDSSPLQKQFSSKRGLVGIIAVEEDLFA